ncbi:hypothetical protein [Brevundimonas sp.]|uniref:hypothetical protein n=1 Tax=Brevundimonas sp. TaxID=1871086 RepID=UPI003BAA98F2
MTKQTTAHALAGQLFAAEAAIDAALTETASLIAMFPAARAEALLSAVVGQRAFHTTAAAVSALTEARGQLVATHHTLSALARRMGLETLAVGPLDKPRERRARFAAGGGGSHESHTA